jgi:NTE family protein
MLRKRKTLNLALQGAAHAKPFDINPLRKIISELIDFKALRSPRAIRLFIAATRLSTGTLKLLENAELSTEALLASACLPTLSHAIEIDGES